MSKATNLHSAPARQASGGASDANDRLTHETGTQPFDYVYDAAGNLTQKKQGSTVVASYEWSAENHLLRATLGTGTNAVSTHYSYDASGIRRAQEVLAAGQHRRTEYLVDPNQAYAQVLEDWEAQAASGSPLPDESPSVEPDPSSKL